MNEKLPDGLLKDVRHFVVSFLVKHGGMTNGYETWIEGSPGFWQISLPRSDNKTLGEMKALANKFDEELKAVLKKHEFDFKCMLVIKKEHLEWGCYRMIVTFSQSLTIW